MLNFNTIFEIPEYSEWIQKLEQDLSAEEFRKLSSFDPIEEIHQTPHAHSYLLNNVVTNPGIFPYTRGLNRSDNVWKNGKFLPFENEFETNKKALDILMKGCDLLIFDLPETTVNLTSLLAGVGLEHIETQFEIHSHVQLKCLLDYFAGGIPSTVALNIDPIVLDQNEFIEISTNLKKRQFKCFVINGHKILQTGASSYQELAFCLSAGHHTLFKLMEFGLDIDEAAACIHFSLGIGQNYFMEIAKFRALRTLWSNIIAAYKPQHGCSYNCSVTAHTIPLNKSLKDPYTNLLRQTTEAMSAINGGVQGLVIHPYDSESAEPSSALAERMALNISLLLKDESHFDAVNDPMGGSYTVELLTRAIGTNAWEFFKTLETEGGIHSKQSKLLFTQKVEEKKQQRIEQIRSGERILIGINKFHDPEKRDVRFKPEKIYLGMRSLILERDIITNL